MTATPTTSFHRTAAMRQLFADFLLTQTRQQLDTLALPKDIPLHTMR